jgi:hypothetical protein
MVYIEYINAVGLARSKRWRPDMIFCTINALGRSNLIALLTDILKTGNAFAESHADDLIANFDGADKFYAFVEVKGFHTKSGNAETYTFDKDELNFFEEIDE